MLTQRTIFLALLATALLLPSPSWCKKRKKKEPAPLEGPMGKLQEMVVAMTSKGLLETAQAGELTAMAEEAQKQFQGYRENALKGEEMRAQYEEKMQQMQDTYQEMLQFKDSIPEDIVEAERELRNARRRVEQLEHEGKDWEKEVTRLALDLKKAYDMHKDDRREIKRVEQQVEKREGQIAMLEEELTGVNQRFDTLHQHAASIDSLKAAEDAAEGGQTAMKMKDERIAYLKENNRRVMENNNVQTQRFRKQIADLETERDRLMQRGPHRQEVIKLQEESKTCKQELQECKSSLGRKEELYSEAQLARNDLVHSVTGWNKKYADCMAESRDLKQKLDQSESAPEYPQPELYDADSNNMEGSREDSQPRDDKLENVQAALKAKEEAYDELKIKYQDYYQTATSLNMKFSGCMQEMRYFKKMFNEAEKEINRLNDAFYAEKGEQGEENTESTSNQAKIASLEKEIAQCKDTKEDNIALREELTRKKDVIKRYEQYSDADQCMKDRLKQQMNMDRMAQENMKFANCNVRWKKLQARFDKLLNETESGNNCGDLNTQIYELNQESTKLKTELETTMNALTEVKTAKEEMDRRYAHLKTATDVKKHKMQIEIDHFKGKHEQCEETATEMEDKLKTARAPSADCTQNIAYLEGQRDKLIQKQVEQEGMVGSLERKLKQAKKENEALLAKNKEIEDELNQAQTTSSDSSGKDEEIVKLNKKVELQTNLKEKLMDANKKLIRHNEELSDAVNSYKAKEGDVPNCAAEYAGIIEGKDSQIKAQKGVIEGQQKDVKQRIQQLKELSDTHERALKECQCHAEQEEKGKDVQFVSDVTCDKSQKEETPETPSDCNKQDTEIAQLKADITKKDELISFLRNYNDPSGCIADRVKMQKNLDRMAQENMKFANCNVRKKKLEAKLEAVTSNISDLESKTATLEKEVSECQTELEAKPSACPENAVTTNVDSSEVTQLQEDIKKKDELISYLRKYTDPTGCMADRVSMQKNLDRMAQENMKFANCNVRRKKLEAKLEQYKADLSTQEEDFRMQLADSRNHAGEVNMENNRLRKEVQKWKQTHNHIHDEAKKRGQSVEEASEVIVLKTELEIQEDRVNQQRRIIDGQKKDIQRRMKEFKALTADHEKAMKECECRLEGDGEEAIYVSDVTCDVTTCDGAGPDIAKLKTSLEETEKERNKYKADFIEFSGKHTDCKMEKHNCTGWNLHYTAVIRKQKEQLEALRSDCNCEQATICDDNTARFEEMQDRALNCENTLKFTREKAEKYTALHAAASRNYTELREECQGYYDDLQLCTQDKNEIEFVKNGLDMVLKQVEDDHKKKMGNLEDTTKDAVKNETTYRNYFLLFSSCFTLLALYDLFTYLKRRFTEHEVKVKEQKQAAKISAKESKKKR